MNMPKSAAGYKWLLMHGSVVSVLCGCGRRWRFIRKTDETRDTEPFVCRCGNKLLEANFRTDLVGEEMVESLIASKQELLAVAPKSLIPTGTELSITTQFEEVKRFRRAFRVIFCGNKKFLVDDLELDKAVYGTC
jgi:hypothetical protein